ARVRSLSGRQAEQRRLGRAEQPGEEQQEGEDGEQPGRCVAHAVPPAATDPPPPGAGNHSSTSKERPCSLSMRTRPPWARTVLWTSASPRPVPGPTPLVV